jgi:hypothetical protein
MHLFSLPFSSLPAAGFSVFSKAYSINLSSTLLLAGLLQPCPLGSFLGDIRGRRGTRKGSPRGGGGQGRKGEQRWEGWGGGAGRSGKIRVEVQ